MSLARLALRLAAIEALCPFATSGAGPYPTIAGRQVYDSRIDRVESSDEWESFLTSVEGNPLVIVYTEEHETTPKPGSNYHAQEDVVDLVIELMIAARADVTVEGGAGPQTVGTLAAPVTDRQREALLDFLEAQVRNALDPTSIANRASLFRQAGWEVRHVHSLPQREETGMSRVAARSCKFRCKVPADLWPQYPSGAPPQGLARLPEPLRTVANGLDPGSSAGQLCAALAELVAHPERLTPLTDVFLGPQWARTWPPTFTPPTAEAVANETAPADMLGDAKIPQTEAPK